MLGAPTEAQRNADLGGLLAWGLAQYHRVKAIDSRRVYGLAETGYGRAAGEARRRASDGVRDGARRAAARRAGRR